MDASRGERSTRNGPGAGDQQAEGEHTLDLRARPRLAGNLLGLWLGIGLPHGSGPVGNGDSAFEEQGAGDRDEEQGKEVAPQVEKGKAAPRDARKLAQEQNILLRRDVVEDA